MTLSPQQDVAYLGSDLHVSQGIELQSWQFDGSNLSFELDLGHEAEGMIYLYCQSVPSAVKVDGEEVYWIQETEKLISIALSFAEKTWVKLAF